MPEHKPNNQRYKFTRQMGLAVTIPMVLLAGPLVGWFIGSWLDKKFNTHPWLMIIVSILGFIAGVRQTIHMIRDISRDDKN